MVLTMIADVAAKFSTTLFASCRFGSYHYGQTHTTANNVKLTFEWQSQFTIMADAAAAFTVAYTHTLKAVKCIRSKRKPKQITSHRLRQSAAPEVISLIDTCARRLLFICHCFVVVCIRAVIDLVDFSLHLTRQQRQSAVVILFDRMNITAFIAFQIRTKLFIIAKNRCTVRD